MSESVQMDLNGIDSDESDDQDCDCTELPDGIPCAECFIAGEAAFGEAEW